MLERDREVEGRASCAAEQRALVCTDILACGKPPV